MVVSYSLGEIAAQLGGEVLGDSSVVVTRMASLAGARKGELSFLANSKYRHLLSGTQASAVVVGHADRDATDLPRIVCDNAYAYFARVSTLMNPSARPMAGIHPSAVVDPAALVSNSASVGAHAYVGPGATLDNDVVIGPGCMIHDHVKIGAGSHLQSNVTVYADCVVGRACVLSAGVVIGADGFGYAEDNGRWVKIPQVGRVILGDYVEIGANTTIDRGALDDTIVEEGVKLDNLIQIGHNCRIGAHTVIAGCVGIAGSAVIGRHCRIGGAAMILGHLEIADRVTVSPGSMITRSLSASDTYTALMPFQTHAEWLRTAAHIRHLDKLARRISSLEEELEAFKKEQS